MQRVQQHKRLQAREGKEADTSRVFARRWKKDHAKICCLREKEKERKRRVGASDKDGKATAAYKSTWMNPHNCNCPSSLTPDRSGRCTHAYMCVCYMRVCVSSGTYPTRIHVSVTLLLTQGCSEIWRLKLLQCPKHSSVYLQSVMSITLIPKWQHLRLTLIKYDCIYKNR